VLQATSVRAQLPNPYGAAIDIANAKTVAAAALAEAQKNGWREIVAIVDAGGELVYLERMDGTQTASITLAIEKARSAVRFKRPTKAFEEALASGGAGIRFLGFPGVLPSDGGVPIVMDGKIVGAIGVSGATGAQDGQCANAGASAVK
jgi:uncharacterized protein GlcG (DUF336 family)